MSDENRDIDDYTSKYLQAPFESYQVFYRRKKILEQMKLYQHQRVLEIGCGCEPLFKYTDDVEQWVVIEPSNEFYENARRIATNNVEIVHDYFNEHVVSKLGGDRAFDLIICSSLLHELANPEEVLRNIWKICSNETVVHVNVPNAKSLHRLLASCMGVISDIYVKSAMQKKMQQADVVYDISSLKKTCTENGFEIINEGSYFVKPFTHQQMQDCLDKEIFNDTLLDGLDRLIQYMPEYGSEIFVELKKESK